MRQVSGQMREMPKWGHCSLKYKILEKAQSKQCQSAYLPKGYGITCLTSWYVFPNLLVWATQYSLLISLSPVQATYS